MHPKEIALEFPHVVLAHKVHAPLAYYRVDRGETVADVAAAEASMIRCVATQSGTGLQVGAGPRVA